MSTLDQVITELQTAKTNIGTAIIAKGGTVNSGDGFSDYSTDIGTIPIPIVEKDVNFYDYDGTLVKSYTIAEAQALTALPSPPDHSADTTPLTFQEWNYTLAQVNATTSPLDVGATYITTDGKTHFHITLTAVSGLAPTLYFNKSDGSTLTVDWGDGTTNDYTNTGNFNTGAHTYASAGNYIIKTWISSGSGTYGFGNGSSSTVAIGGATAVYLQTLTKCFIGNNVTSVGDYAFIGNYSLQSIVIPASVTSIGLYAFNSCFSLTKITIPTSITNISSNAFSSCYGFAEITIPTSVTSINSNVFNNCRSLTKITIPASVTSVGASAFSTCYLLAEIIIPASVTSIDASAFSSCFSCKIYNIQATTPPTLAATNAFSGIVSICKIRVPSASLAAYQTATNWSTYANYMEGY